VEAALETPSALFTQVHATCAAHDDPSRIGNKLDPGIHNYLVRTPPHKRRFSSYIYMYIELYTTQPGSRIYLQVELYVVYRVGILPGRAIARKHKLRARERCAGWKRATLRRRGRVQGNAIARALHRHRNG
jgi:hypothetical protein